jgi:hypothetical protein
MLINVNNINLYKKERRMQRFFLLSKTNFVLDKRRKKIFFPITYIRKYLTYTF